MKLWNSLFALFMFGCAIYYLAQMPSESGHERTEAYVKFYGSLMIGWFLLVINYLERIERRRS